LDTIIGIIGCQTIPSNVVVGLCCFRNQHNTEWQLEEFGVLEIIFNLVVKNEIGVLVRFEGLLRYVKLTPI
jgi:hypothetical protein